MILTVGNKTKKLLLLFAKIINNLFSPMIKITVEDEDDNR